MGWSRPALQVGTLVGAGIWMFDLLAEFSWNSGLEVNKCNKRADGGVGRGGKCLAPSLFLRRVSVAHFLSGAFRKAWSTAGRRVA